MSFQNIKSSIHILILIVLCCTFYACSTSALKHYEIGVSLCNDDLWHQSVITELQHEAQFYSDIQLDIQTNRNGDDAKQIAIIESFIEQGKDLLVVSAGNAALITPIVERAYQANIPVIILDQRIETKNYTAYIGGDNYRIGQEVARYIANRLEGKGNIVELRGRTESLTDIQRDQGFKDVLASYPNLHIVAEDRADFDTQLAQQKMSEIIGLGHTIDIVFAMDDLTAKGVYNAYHGLGLRQPFTIGVDALAGENGGMENISKGYQDISFIYPTGAEKVLEIAHKISLNQEFEKENILYTGVVDQSNVGILLKQKEQIRVEQQKSGVINTELNQTKNKNLTQRTILYSSILIIILITTILLIGLRSYLKKHQDALKLRLEYKKIEEEHAKIVLENKEIQKQLHVLSEPSTPQEELSEDQKYIIKFRDYVTKHISDSSLDVETLSELFNESYTQMYRKIKAITGYTPIEFVRLIRLTYAKQLLSTTSKNISTVAYESGFSSPSYFTQCFKKYYKESPKEFLKNRVAGTTDSAIE